MSKFKNALGFVCNHDMLTYQQNNVIYENSSVSFSVGATRSRGLGLFEVRLAGGSARLLNPRGKYESQLAICEDCEKESKNKGDSY